MSIFAALAAATKAALAYSGSQMPSIASRRTFCATTFLATVVFGPTGKQAYR